MLLAIFWPVAFHGTFDFFLFLPRNNWNGWLLFGGAVVSFIVAVKLSLKLIRRKQEMSKNHFINLDTMNKEGHDII